MHGNTLDQLENSKLQGSIGLTSEEQEKIQDLTIHQNTAYLLNQVAERMIRLNQDLTKSQDKLAIHESYMGVIKDLQAAHLRTMPCGPRDSYQDELVKECAHLAYLHRQKQNEVDHGILKEFNEERKIQAGEKTSDKFEFGGIVEGIHDRKISGEFKARKLVSKKKRK